MATSSKVALLAAVALAGIAGGAALNAQDRPESLLPPGFNQPVPQPSETPTPQPSDEPAAPPPPPTVPGAQPLPAPGEQPVGNAQDAATDAPPAYQLPDYARRSLDRVGVGGVEGLPADAFGRADGRFLQRLMRLTEAPLASRWLSILLRRTLVSAVDTPRNANGADFAAERAWLLIRMGEATAARAVVQGVDSDNATPKLMQVTMQAALATGDPAAMCPYAEAGLGKTREAGWVLARAMCFAMAGEPAQATAAIGAAKRRGVGRGIDLALAEKVVGAGAQGRRAVTIEWPGVDGLTAWRWGLSAATGVEVPEDMMATAGRQVRYWHALSPIYLASARAADAELAAAQGVLSNLALVDLYGEVEDQEESGTAAGGIARDLRQAYAGGSGEDRLSALKGLWDEPAGATGKYARLVLTARAAARVRPSEGAEEADRLVASMLTAGLDRAARRWLAVAPVGGDAWAMLTVAEPRGRALTYAQVDDYDGSAAKQAMLFAGLAGLGRLNADEVARGADDLGLNLAGGDAWSRAIDAAARADQPGTVVLLCAAGMQTSDWRGVSPAMLFRMVAALRATGLEGYGRMIAAEAITRLPA